MTDEERTEDLNPRSEDIDEKVRRMMDPSVPDESEDTPSDSKTKPKPKTKDRDEPSKDKKDNLQTAPELPNKSKPKKLVIPISHDDTKPEIEATEEVQAEEAPIRQITVADAAKSPAEVAEKLDQAIAELEPTDQNAEPASDAIATAPALPASLKDNEAETPTEQDETLLLPKSGDKAEDPLPEETVVTDPETDKVVEEIISRESDQLLEAEDAARTIETFTPPTKPRRRLFGGLKTLFSKRGFKRTVIFLLLIGIIAATLVPKSRYLLLNTVGVRASTTLMVVDNSTQLPLKNAKVSIGSNSATTDTSGVVKLEHLRLGPATLKIEKLAFAGLEQSFTVGWGSNKLGDFKLTPTGEQYDFNVTDFLSGQPITGAEVTSGEVSALSDSQGNIKLTVPASEETKLVVKITAKDYRQESLTIDLADKTSHKLQLVPGRKHVFVSKRTGRYNIYSIYVDGREEKLVLEGSGYERDDLVLIPNPAANVAAYVSTRADKRNDDDYLLSDLIVIDLNTNDTTSVATKERIQVIGWSGDWLVYVEVKSADSAADPKRNRLMSYNYLDGSTKELATSNYFNDLVLGHGVIYFAPSSAYAGGTPAQFYRVNPDGSGLKSLFGQEVWNLLRTSYDHLALSVTQNWYDYQLGDDHTNSLSNAPASRVSRIYIDGPDGKSSLWVDQRDGKGVLLVYDLAKGKDKILHTQSGLNYPITWLDNHTVIYRVDSDQETADYVISVNGGEPVKVRDVTSIGGVDNWYYY